MKELKYRFLLLLSLLLLLTAGCKSGSLTSYGSPGTGTLGNGGGTPTRVDVLLSPSSIVNGGSTTVTATVRDGAGTPVQNYTVSFSVISALTGSFSVSSVLSDGSGQATTTFTAASPAADNSTATIQATITVNSVPINGSAQLTIGFPPQVPSSVVVSLNTSTIANLGSTTVTATVRDASSALIAGEVVTFSVSPNSGAGSFSPAATATTNLLGQATVTFTALAAGNDSLQNITATAGTVSSYAQVQIGTPTPPTPISASITVNPLSINILSPATVSVTVMGAGGMPAYNTAVSLSITTGATLASFSTSTLVSSVTVTTNASGIASTPIYSQTSSGTVTVSATVSPLAPVSASFTITSEPNSMTLSVVNSNLVVGQTTNITADVRNVMNNPVDNGTSVAFAISSGTGGTLSASSASTINGVASVTFTATAPGSMIVKATVTTSTGTITQQAIIIVNAAQAGSLQYVSVNPASGVIPTKGYAATLTFKVLDVTGQPLSGQTVTFQAAIVPSEATLSPTSGTTNVSGLVTTQITSGNIAGPVRILASVTVQGTTTTLYASSGALSIGGGVPSYKWFSLSVEKLNLPALNCDNSTDTVYVNMADRFGNYNILQGTAVSFQTYYGAIDTSNITNDMGQTQAVFRTQKPRPSNGRVRILVQTTGEEAFTDMNGNFVYDAGDILNAADDLPEPYIDANANGAHDAGETYFNWPITVPSATSVYNGPNGVWDANIPIWNTIDILLTSAPSATTSGIKCCNPATGTTLPGCTLITGNFTLVQGSSTSSTNCYVYGYDVNGNPLAAGTTVTLTSDKSDATIDLVSGSATYADSQTGEPTGYQVTNNTSSATSVSAHLRTTINWTGDCATANVTIPYAGTITLSPAPPAAPTNLLATPGTAGTGIITLTWAASTGAISYNVYSDTVPGVTTADTKTTGVSSGYQFPGVTGTTYYFVVSAVNSVGETLSAEVSAMAP